MEATKFVCKCGIQEAWIHEGYEILPCPICARYYKGVYDKKQNTLKAKEIKKFYRSWLITSWFFKSIIKKLKITKEQK